MWNEIRIFEIPIYGTRFDSFRKKWDDHIKKKVSYLVTCGWEPKKAEERCREWVFPKNIWKYSQIVGYLTIDITATDMFFEVYAPIGERYRYNLSRKLNIQCWNMNGCHFRLDENMSNSEMLEQIYQTIREIEKSSLKKWYLDMSTFDNVARYIDYCAIRDNLKGET